MTKRGFSGGGARGVSSGGGAKGVSSSSGSSVSSSSSSTKSGSGSTSGEGESSSTPSSGTSSTTTTKGVTPYYGSAGSSRPTYYGPIPYYNGVYGVYGCGIGYSSITGGCGYSYGAQNSTFADDTTDGNGTTSSQSQTTGSGAVGMRMGKGSLVMMLACVGFGLELIL